MPSLTTDIQGLDLLLGGGISIVKRTEASGESATILIRGAPGTGKTVLGTQLGCSLARQLACDVAYGCVEILPAELAAQHQGLAVQGRTRVVIAPFTNTEADGSLNIFAGNLDIGDPGDEPLHIVSAILGLLQAVEQAGGRPRVLVIDSLSDGYNLGSKAPRILADELCKMAAERGMVLVLLEEIINTDPSVWSFAVDIVIELEVRRLAETKRRSLAILKNRFGPADPGMHQFDIQPGTGVEIFPTYTAYLHPWADRVLFHDGMPAENEWTWGAIQNLINITGLGTTRPPVPHANPLTRSHQDRKMDLPPFGRSVSIVFSNEYTLVLQIAAQLGLTSNTYRGIDVFLNVGRYNIMASSGHIHSNFITIFLGDPMMDGSQWLATALNALARIEGPVGRVFMGDFRAIGWLYADDVRNALMTLLVLLRRRGVPTILFETGVVKGQSQYQILADVTIRVGSQGRPQATVTATRTAQLGTIDLLPAELTSSSERALLLMDAI